MITEPGVYDLPADQYHADPVPGGSLSSSGARKLLPPSCPALFRHWADTDEQHTPAFDLGKAAHMRVLGAGPSIVVIDADDWRTKAAREARDTAHANGQVPLLAADNQRVTAMAGALRAHPYAAALLDPDRGRPEQTLVWQDEATGVWCRAMLDWLPDPGTGRMLLADYKTCESASPEHIRRAVHQYGYHQQADWYTTAVQALNLAQDVAFLFIFQMKTPPYLVTVAQLDDEALTIGADRNRQAREIYRDCTQAGIWPGHTTDVELISLPPYVLRAHREW